MKRSIKLKEHFLSHERIIRPTSFQVEQCPDLCESGYKLVTDGDGFIVSGNDFQSNIKTIVLGDSFVESTFLAERDRFCSIIERLAVEERLLNIGQVLNAGVSGSTSLNLLNVILNKIVPLSPSIVVFVLPSNDSQVHRFAKTYWNDSDYYANLIPSDKKDSVGDFGENLIKSDFLNIMSIVIESCNAFGIKLILATCPYAENYNGEFFVKKYKNKAWFDANIHARKILNDKLRSISTIRRIGLIDLESFIGGKNKYFYDDVHLNRDGSRVVGDFVYRHIKSILNR